MNKFSDRDRVRKSGQFSTIYVHVVKDGRNWPKVSACNKFVLCGTMSSYFVREINSLVAYRRKRHKLRTTFCDMCRGAIGIGQELICVINSFLLYDLSFTYLSRDINEHKSFGSV